MGRLFWDQRGWRRKNEVVCPLLLRSCGSAITPADLIGGFRPSAQPKANHFPEAPAENPHHLDRRLSRPQGDSKRWRVPPQNRAAAILPGTTRGPRAAFAGFHGSEAGPFTFRALWKGLGGLAPTVRRSGRLGLRASAAEKEEILRAIYMEFMFALRIPGKGARKFFRR